jgi:hypothetical protein
LGHKVDIVTFKDSFKWFKHKKVIKDVPKNTDVVIAISILDVPLIYKKYHGKHKLAYYSRPVECDTKGHKWQVSKKKALATLQKFNKHNGIVISNSSWQIDWLKKHGIKSTLVYSGLDLDEYYPVPNARFKDVHIGALHHKFHKTKRWDLVEKVAKNLDVNKYYFEVLTADKKGTGGNHMAYWYQPPLEDKRRMYSTCKIWFSPTEAEGFHNVAAEANLCGSLVVCNRLKRNGMQDYATDETAMRYDNFEELIECIENPDFSKVEKMQNILTRDIGSREKNMKHLIKVLK